MPTGNIDNEISIKLVSKAGDVFKLVVQFEKQSLTQSHTVRN